LVAASRRGPLKSPGRGSGRSPRRPAEPGKLRKLVYVTLPGC